MYELDLCVAKLLVFEAGCVLDRAACCSLLLVIQEHFEVSLVHSSMYASTVVFLGS